MPNERDAVARLLRSTRSRSAHAISRSSSTRGRSFPRAPRWRSPTSRTRTCAHGSTRQPPFEGRGTFRFRTSLHAGSRAPRSSNAFSRTCDERRASTGSSSSRAIPTSRSAPTSTRSISSRKAASRRQASRRSASPDPDGHPRIKTPELWSALERKIRALQARGLDAEIVTQFSFDADAVLRWLGELGERNIHVPVKIGVPGPISLTGHLHFAARSGVSASRSALQKYGTSIGKVVGTVGPLAFLQRLTEGLEQREHDRIALHFFTFGALVETVKWTRRQG